MKLKELNELLAEAKKPLPLIDIVYGSSRKGMKWGDKIFDYMMLDKENRDGSIKYEEAFVVKQMKKVGLSKDEISKIQKITIKAYKESLKMIQKKHKEVTNEWVYEDKALFGKLSLYYNVPNEIRIEFNKGAKRIIEKELKKTFKNR